MSIVVLFSLGLMCLASYK